MGGRVEGKKKKKSVKANVTSKFSSKRLLSRMGKKVQSGKAGPSTEFITRSSAIRRLQITLKDFRRLCILKGIYPRVPSKALSGADKIYYDIKDISYIMHEPLLEKFREFKTFMKKIRKAAGRNQHKEARRKNDLKPQIKLDHLVKERYPRFIDALRDLDDALCMIHLFAALPSVGRITSERTLNCKKLSREWQYYLAKSHSLRKVFVSVKGIYYQAEIMGESITWLVPHSFTQHMPQEVDFRVMLTFLDFYEVFLRFTLFKLYHNQGWQYPPVVDTTLDKEGSCLLAMKSDELDKAKEEEQKNAAKLASKTASEKEEKLTKAIDSKTAAQIASLPKLIETIKEQDDSEDEEEVDLSGPLTAAFSDLQGVANESNDETEKKIFASAILDEKRTNIFSGLTFFLNREVPLEWLQFCVTSFGGRVGWDNSLSPIKLDDPSITHHVIDRPTQGSSLLSREYIQPQWIFDSINAKLLLPCRLYAPGSKLPPHLSPFVDDEKEGYMPRYREEIQKLQLDAGIISELPSRGSRNPVASDADQDDSDDEDDADEEDDEDDDEEEEDAKPVTTNLASQKGPKAIVYAPKSVEVDEATEIKNLSIQMMSKKTKRLYGRMQHGIEQKNEAVKTLELKRKAADEEKQPSSVAKKAVTSGGASKKSKAK